MKLKQWGRIALLVGVSAVLGLGTLSCTDYTLGYLFVTSGRYSQIYTYIVDANTGGFRLLNTEPNNYGGKGNPGSSGGNNPTKLVTAAAGTYLYVLNEGTANVQLFTVGGDGVLFSVNGIDIQPNLTGQYPIDMKLSADGNYLYVLNQYAPTIYTTPGTSDTPCVTVPSLTCPGAIAVYSIGNKGVLTPVANTNNTSGPTIYYFPVGYLPVQMYAGGGSVFTVDSASSDIWIWNVASTGGGLLQPAVDQVLCQAVGGGNCDLVALTGNGAYVYAADQSTGYIYGYAIGSGGLSAIPGGPFYVCGASNPPACASNPGPNFLTFDPSGKYLYVSTTLLQPVESSPTPESYVYGFYLPSSGVSPGTIAFINGSAIGSNPQCLAISTGTEYLYSANYNDGTVSGQRVVTLSGALTAITGGPATQTTAGQANCVVFSSRH